MGEPRIFDAWLHLRRLDLGLSLSYDTDRRCFRAWLGLIFFSVAFDTDGFKK